MEITIPVPTNAKAVVSTIGLKRFVPDLLDCISLLLVYASIVNFVIDLLCTIQVLGQLFDRPQPIGSLLSLILKGKLAASFPFRRPLPPV
jgi:hypothetical protein